MSPNCTNDPPYLMVALDVDEGMKRHGKEKVLC